MICSEINQPYVDAPKLYLLCQVCSIWKGYIDVIKGRVNMGQRVNTKLSLTNQDRRTGRELCRMSIYIILLWKKWFEKVRGVNRESAGVILLLYLVLLYFTVERLCHLCRDVWYLMKLGQCHSRISFLHLIALCPPRAVRSTRALEFRLCPCNPNSPTIYN